MVIVVILLLILVVGGLVAASLFGVLQIEKVELETPDEQFPVPGAPQQDTDAELDDAASLKEKMDLADLFEQQPDDAEEEQRFVEIDRLTNFKTGRGFLIDCQTALNSARQEGHLCAAVWFDFDRFRFINSLKGVSIGDYVLANIGRELPNVFPEGALLTRLSADHFVAVFPVLDMDIFASIAERLQGICERIRSDIAVKSGLRICMGVAVAENAQRDYDAGVLLHKANIARHSIKQERNEVWKLYEDTMISSYLYGESALEDYNENQYDEEFVIFFAPQQDLVLQRIVGSEALVHWVREIGDVRTLPPTKDKGKLPTNGGKVIYQVCRAMSRWRKSGKQVLPVSVSIPITDLYKEDLDAFLGRCLNEFQLEPSMLAIVIDAAAARVDWSTVSHQLKKLRDIGVKCGVDDIDTGFHSLDFLGGLPLNFIKLQRGVANEVDKDEQQRETATRLLALAKGLNLQVVFEGVHAREQAVALQELGARTVQGQYCGKPQLAEDFMQGLPDYVETDHSLDGTVILDDIALNKGDFEIF